MKKVIAPKIEPYIAPKKRVKKEKKCEHIYNSQLLCPTCHKCGEDMPPDDDRPCPELCKRDDKHGHVAYVSTSDEFGKPTHVIWLTGFEVGVIVGVVATLFAEFLGHIVTRL